MTERLHIVEPTLKGNAGHNHSFVASVCAAAGSTPITVWCAAGAELSLPPTVEVRRIFTRRLRRWQAFWLYRRLLRGTGRIFVSTAQRTDLQLLHWAAGGPIAAGRVVAYMHWFRPSQRKRDHITALARKQPALSVFAPTASVADEFRAAGFADTRVVPYPITPQASTAPAGPFRHLLYAGAARQDKGFHAVVDLVERLARTQETLPIRVQTSADHGSAHDDATRDDLQRLSRIAYAPLQRSDTLSPEDYRERFNGAISLQLYSQHDFADRISGVTLDSLSAGAPVVTLSNTWISRVVEEFGAGEVLDTPDADAVFGAVQRIHADYPAYRDRALAAGRALQERNGAHRLVQELLA
jgi:glycosyltransferase involved in cell wall biosynthesis